MRLLWLDLMRRYEDLDELQQKAIDGFSLEAGELAEVLNGGAAISLVSGLFGRKTPEIKLLLPHSYPRHPSVPIAVRVGPFEPVTRGSRIAPVLAGRGDAQIPDSVVTRIAVFVVNVFKRVFTVIDRPRDPMRLVVTLIDHDDYLPARERIAGYRSGPNRAAAFAPAQKAGAGVVLQNRAEKFNVYSIGFMHDHL